MTTALNIAFMPLVDASLLIAAHELGFADQEGLALNLIRETSWANIRDRMVVGHFQAAHMLAPLPIAGRLGMSSLPLDTIVPMALGLGGNAVTISTRLADVVAPDAGHLSGLDAGPAGRVLKNSLAKFEKDMGRKMVCGVVHPHSSHNYELRYWLNASGIDPDHDVEIAIVPPPLMPDAMAAGSVDLFCVGEPWNTVSVARGHGHVFTTKASIWRSSPEKVLAVSNRLHDQQPETVAALVRSLVQAANWCADPDHHVQLAELLARPHYLDMEPKYVMAALSGLFHDIAGQLVAVPDFFLPAQRLATFPWQSHALWFYSQMVRWGQTNWDAQMVERVKQTYRPDIYRDALRGFGVDLPAADMKVEGALADELPVGSTQGRLFLGPDGFFDGLLFDPSAFAKDGGGA
ncbi:MAG: CmpA/NrtA family ABC transporter substrate-binding protein [Pseudomonadota bacterium]